jgi:hypothetical protein
MNTSLICERICEIGGCTRQARATGLCGAHYERKRSGADLLKPLGEPRQTNKGKLCLVPDCTKPADTKGMCPTHYYRIPRGIPLTIQVRKWRYGETLCSVEGCEDKAKSRELCQFHYRRKRHGIELVGPKKRLGMPTARDRWLDEHGYVRVIVPKGTPGSMRYTNLINQALEHRLVLQNHLGRALLPTETVHHKNGDRSDNRLENLELKAGAHGRGITVPNAVTAAIATLRRYAKITKAEEAGLLRRVRAALQFDLGLDSTR